MIHTQGFLKEPEINCLCLVMVYHFLYLYYLVMIKSPFLKSTLVSEDRREIRGNLRNCRAVSLMPVLGK